MAGKLNLEERAASERLGSAGVGRSGRSGMPSALSPNALKLPGMFPLPVKWEACEVNGDQTQNFVVATVRISDSPGKALGTNHRKR